jgi:transcription antitermination protein NusB
MQALYRLEASDDPVETVVEETAAETEAEGEQRDYMERIVVGVRGRLEEIDERLSARIPDYDYSRIAAVDRNVMRVAAYELFFEEAVPPAVTLNEAIEIAKKFSTAESGRFVNGVLGRLVKDSPKAHWDPRNAPVEFREERYVAPEPEPEVEMVTPDSEEVQEAARVGAWKLRSGDREVPPMTEGED